MSMLSLPLKDSKGKNKGKYGFKFLDCSSCKKQRIRGCRIDGVQRKSASLFPISKEESLDHCPAIYVWEWLQIAVNDCLLIAKHGGLQARFGKAIGHLPYSTVVFFDMVLQEREEIQDHIHYLESK